MERRPSQAVGISLCKGPVVQGVERRPVWLERREAGEVTLL